MAEKEKKGNSRMIKKDSPQWPVLVKAIIAFLQQEKAASSSESLQSGAEQ